MFIFMHDAFKKHYICAISYQHNRTSIWVLFDSTTLASFPKWEETGLSKLGSNFHEEFIGFDRKMDFCLKTSSSTSSFIQITRWVAISNYGVFLYCSICGYMKSGSNVRSCPPRATFVLTHMPVIAHWIKKQTNPRCLCLAREKITVGLQIKL